MCIYIYINACDKLSVLLCLCFNSMILHGYVTEGFSDTILIPIIKDKKGNITDPDNYRPIAITSVTSKIFENILLKRLQSYICTSDNQFGFKPKHSTDMCVFVLKQIIDYYLSMSSPLYICYLDASKAFDRLNYWLLFDKLIERGTPRILVRFLLKWYCSQEFIVRWGNTLSMSFNVTNGVRQGGILSPVLFNVYVDGLSTILNKTEIGCKFNGLLYNHLIYADDTVIIAPSAHV